MKTTNAELQREVRLAWQRMVAHQQTANIQKPLRSLWRFHTIRSRFQDGAILIAQAAEETEAEQDGERSVLLGQVLTQQGSYYTHFGRFEEARESLQQSLKWLRSGADRAGLAHTLAVLAYMKTRLGEFQEAQQHAEESISLKRALGDQDEFVYWLSLWATSIWHREHMRPPTGYTAKAWQSAVMWSATLLQWRIA